MGKTFPFPLILASGSQGRRALMTQAGYTFTVQPADIDEPTEARLGNCQHYVSELAWLKAAAVAPSIENGVVIAADTVGWHNGNVVGKPDDRDHARRIISELSGTTHELWTGVCLWHRPSGFQLCWQELSRVRMKQFTSMEIDAYLDTRQWVGCSGAYAIRDTDDPYLTVIEGSMSNVIGLPMESLERGLHLMETIAASAIPPTSI